MAENLCTCFACTGPARLEATEQELRNVRAGVYGALSLLGGPKDGIARQMLRSCLPDGYLPVGMGGDPDIAASIPTNESETSDA